MITLIQREWTYDIARQLMRACGDDIADIADDVMSGRAELFEVQKKGYVVLRLEQLVNGKELVIVAGEGRGLREVMPVLIDIGINNGANSIRLHTQRKGIEKMAGRFGFLRDEVVMKKVIGNGQQVIKS